MGPQLPSISGERVVAALTRAGFVVERVAGSHHIMEFPGQPSRTVTVPVHGNRDLKPGTLRSIIRQSGLTVDELVALL
jgi:predicted RNA binding protein YcfA (HicA-like mRNA interferase family)